MDFLGNRHNEHFTFKRVGWEDWVEHGSYDYITDGSIELSTESDLVVTGSLSFEGYEVPDTSDLIRIFYSFTDEAGDTDSFPLATLFTSYSDLTYTDTVGGLKASGTLEGKSVLSVLEQEKTPYPYVVSGNSNAIYEAQKIITSLGLPVNYLPGSYVLGSDHAFEPGTSYLEICKWLCEQAGYVMYPDELGVVQLVEYEKIKRAEIRTTFKNDDLSIMYPELEATNSWQETPNVYQLYYNVDTCAMVAVAKNVSGSRASLDKRGNRSQCEFEDISELPSTGDRLENLMNEAETRLRKISADVEYVKMKHAWRPIYIYDQIRIEYSDLSWTGETGNINIELKAGTATQTKIKRELYDEIMISKEGRYLRGDTND